MADSTETSFNLSSSSGRVQGLPALGNSRESSSGASSESRRARRDSPYPQRPPKMSREQELQEMSQLSPNTQSSPLQLEDASRAHLLEPHDSHMQSDEARDSPVHQVFQDHRAIHVDQRSVQFQQHVHGPDPSIVGNLAAQAASSEMRAEAASAVAGVRMEAAQAVVDAV